MSSVTSTSRMRRTMLGMAGAAVVAMVMALSAAPAMAQPLVEQPIMPEQPIASEQPIVNPDLAGFADFDRVVQPGETLSGIAADLGTTHDVLAAENGLQNPHLIFPGQELRH